MRGSRGRRRGRRKSAAARSKRSSASSSSSKSSKSKSKKPSGRSRHTRGGQHAANKRQNKKAKRTVRSVKKAVSRVTKNVRKKVGDISSKVKKGFSIGKAAYGKALRGAAANAATHVANSRYNKQLKQANWTKRDMSKLTPQQQRKYQRLSEKTGRDYSIRKPTFRLNLNADTIARFGKFADKGWYKGLTSRFPGIKTLKINKQFYGNPMKKGWHYSQRTGRGQGVKNIPIRDIPIRDTMMRPEDWKRGQYTTGVERGMGPEPDWLGDLYRSHNISGGKLDQGARDYWSKEAETKGRDAVMQSIIGTAKAQGTYGGRKKPRRITTGPKRSTPNKKLQAYLNARFAGSGHGYPSKAERARRRANRQNQATERQYQYDKKAYNLQAKGGKRRMMKSLAATIAGIRGGVG